MNKKLTVAMPVYNSERYISEAIQSILDQSFSDFEFLIIDDSSTDASKDIIKSFTDKRIHLVELSKRINQPQMRNLAFKLAKSDYIALMDSDDIACVNRLKKEKDFLDEYPEIVAVSSNYQFIGGNTAYRNMPQGWEKIKLASMFYNPIAHPAALIRKSFLQKTGIMYEEDLFVCEDYNFWVDMIKKGKLANIDEYLLQYRTGHTNSTAQSLTDENQRVQRKKILDAIHIKAFTNNGFSLTDDEFITINSFFGDANIKTTTIEKYNALHRVFNKLQAINIQLGYTKAILDAVLEEADSYVKSHYTIATE